MPSWALTIVRWTAAVACMVILVLIALPLAITQLQEAVTFGTDDEPQRAEPAGPPPVVTGDARALAAVGTRSAVVRDVGAEIVALSPDLADEMLIAFERPQVDPACVTSVTLEVSLVESTETDLFVRPARVANLAERSDGDPLPPDAFVDITTPAAAFTSGAPGWLRWDVTDVFSLAVRQSTDSDTLTLRVGAPADDDPERITALHTGTDIDDQRPILSWTAVQGCEDLGTDLPEDADADQET